MATMTPERVLEASAWFAGGALVMFLAIIVVVWFGRSRWHQ